MKRLIYALCLFSFSSSLFGMMKKYPPKKEDLCAYDDRWSGFNVGASAGAFINASDAAMHPAKQFLSTANVPNNPQRTDEFNLHGGGFIGGVQVGGNYQVKELVFGGETDFSYCSLRDSHSLQRDLVSPLSSRFDTHFSQKINWLGTLRGKVGGFCDPILIYATGGMAYGHVSASGSARLMADGSRYYGKDSSWKVGYSIGGGLEWAIDRHWSWKAEYLFVDLGKSRFPSNNLSPPSFPQYGYKDRLSSAGHIVRIGFSYLI